MSGVEDLFHELRELLIRELSLPVSPKDLPVDQPLLGPRGSAGVVAIDSLDMMSLVMAVEDRYGVKLPEDNRELSRMFHSIRSLAENVARLRRLATGQEA